MQNHDRFVALGDKVQDMVTGFTGIAGSITEYLNGCRRIMIIPPLDGDGKYQDEQWFDEPQVKVTVKSAYVPSVRMAEAAAPTGGDRPDPPARLA